MQKGIIVLQQRKDATAHAEMICLREGTKVLGNWRLNDATLYCTLEPCSMCAGAMILSRLFAFSLGSSRLRHGADGSWIDLLGSSHPIHQLQMRRGILKSESAALLTDFFKLRRELQNSFRSQNSMIAKPF